jgi:hypothetical protein
MESSLPVRLNFLETCHSPDFGKNFGILWKKQSLGNVYFIALAIPIAVSRKASNHSHTQYFVPIHHGSGSDSDSEQQ